jgi:hypothetical protein
VLHDACKSKFFADKMSFFVPRFFDGFQSADNNNAKDSTYLQCLNLLPSPNACRTLPDGSGAGFYRFLILRPRGKVGIRGVKLSSRDKLWP